MTSPASSLRDLIVWQEAHKLVLTIYQVTAEFPKSEQYGLASQMRRAAVSVPANIVEGFKRVSYAEKSRFYNMAEASLEELKYYLLLSSDLGYCSETVALTQQADKVGRLLFRFQEGARLRTSNAKPKPNS